MLIVVENVINMIFTRSPLFLPLPISERRVGNDIGHDNGNDRKRRFLWSYSFKLLGRPSR